jgi:hypothetical protein
VGRSLASPRNGSHEAVGALGDCSPGAKVFINTDDVEALHRELGTRPNPNMRPGVEVAPWNAKVVEVIDPFGDRLCFNEPLPPTSP